MIVTLKAIPHDNIELKIPVKAITHDNIELKILVKAITQLNILVPMHFNRMAV